MLDPYYRTLRGFAVLVEGSWLSFGHQFALRHGHADPNYNDDQRAPIFGQWLDCVWQMWRQYPCAFEFTEAALIFVLEHVHSCRYGTFLYNSERERHAQNVAMKTVSIWTPLIDPRHAAQFVNPCFVPVGGVLYPNCSMKKLQVWEGAYMRHDAEARVRTALGVAERSAAACWRYRRLREKLRAMGLDLDELDPEPGAQNSAAPQVAPAAASVPPAAAPATTAAPAAVPTPPPAAQAPPSLPATVSSVSSPTPPPGARPPPGRPPAQAPTPTPAPAPSVTPPPPPAASPSAATSAVASASSPTGLSVASATVAASSSAANAPAAAPTAAAASEVPSRPPPSRPAPILPSVAAASVVTSTASVVTPKSAASPFRPPIIAAASASPNTPTPPPPAAAVSNGRAQLHVRADSSGTPSPASSRVRNSDSPVRTPTKKMAELLSKFQ